MEIRQRLISRSEAYLNISLDGCQAQCLKGKLTEISFLKITKFGIIFSIKTY